MKERKYKGHLISLGILIVVYIITHYLGIDEGLFKVFIAAVIGSEALYDGSNLLVKNIYKDGGGNTEE